ncbi:Fe(II)-dependent oxygenase [Acetobacter sp. DmW_043]|uniref:Fe2+-dependent dioxygenase n=1 Tax=Acetobacter sp. DmW_043 TaxID=1670658 RepID=UPI000A373EA0|nr:Fe2+-dependent dioxygenase [Acetobacter sp. DmW_043]OUI87903.1 Fe(II)-dependent oxygenase [Acetobacter sp. DmW_043]
MLVKIPSLLSTEEVSFVRKIMSDAELVDGRVSAGELAAKAKYNLQLEEGSAAAREAGDVILRALGRNALFNSVAVPLRVLPPMFNRYDVGMRFSAHVDGAIRAVPGANMRMRADLSSTLFLTDPEDYDGGELLIEDDYGIQEIKLPAGDMVIYPATSLHSVSQITRGSRWCSFFWTQSLVKEDGLRNILYNLDCAIIEIRKSLEKETHGVLKLTNVYHNFLRRFAEL